MDKIFRILTFDGGGIRGISQAEIMRLWEILTGKPAHESFDLIVGTSTGAIMTAGLTYHYTADTIVDLYKQRGKDIFVKKKWIQNPFGLVRPTYFSKDLAGVLNEYFGEFDFQKAKTQAMTTAYDIAKGRIQLYKSWKSQGVTFAEAVRASATAPTYFDLFEKNGQLLMDGGIYANNPAQFALNEAYKLGYKNDQICLLSIGTGTTNPSFPMAKNWGAVQFIKSQGTSPLIDCILDAISDAVDYGMGCALPEENYVRVQWQLANAHKDMDKVENIPALLDYGTQAFEDNSKQIKNFWKKIS